VSASLKTFAKQLHEEFINSDAFATESDHDK
jgi:hypothetical protein